MHLSHHRCISVPIALDSPGSFPPLLTEEGSEQPKLAKTSSTPLPGDERLRTLEMFIEVHEMSGTSHELGRFSPEQKVAEVKRKTSQEMCVPEQTLKLVRNVSVTTCTSSASLDSDESSLGDVTKPFTPAMLLQAVVQMPPEYEETLSRLDDIRVHEDVYGQLVSLACEFDSVTSANVNLSKRIIAIIDNGLREGCTHPVSRMWAIEALKKLAKHLLKQARKFDCKATDANGKGDCSDNLRSAIDFITEVFEEVSKSESSRKAGWIEKQMADEALAEIFNAALGGAVRHGGA